MYHKTLYLFLFFAPYWSTGQSCKIIGDSAVMLYRQNDLDAALSTAKRGERICENTGSLKDWAGLLNTLALLYDEKGYPDNAMSYYKKALSLLEKDPQRNNADYALIMENIAGLTEDPDTAVQYSTRALKINKAFPGRDSINYGNGLSHMAAVYHGTGNEQLAFENCIHALNILVAQGKSNDHYLSALNNLGIILEEMGKPEYALQVQQSVLEVRKKIHHPDYIISVNNLAALYTRLGLNEQALSLFLEVADTLKKRYGVQNSNYLSCVNNLASTYGALDQTDAAIAQYEYLLALLTSQQKSNTETYSNTLNNYALLLIYKGDYPRGLAYLDTCVKRRKEILSSQHPLYLQALSNYGRALADTKKYTAAVATAREAVTTGGTVLGKDNPDYVDYAYQLARIYSMAGKTDSVGAIYLANSGRLIKYIADNFSALSTGDRENFINQYLERFDSYASFTAGQNIKNDPSYNGWLYDNILFKKSVLLNSGQLFLRLARSSLDTGNKKTYDAWIRNKSLLARQYAMPVADRVKNFQSLVAETQNQERSLAYNSTAFRAILENNSLSWKDIQSRLQPGDAAIEFISYVKTDSSYSGNTPSYAALLITKNIDQPVFIPLFKAETIQKALATIQATGDDRQKVRMLYAGDKTQAVTALEKLIWQPLSKQLTGIQRIYFSPSGVLNNISFGALRDEKGSFLFNRFELVQLATTKDLVKVVAETAMPLEKCSADMFAGIRYDYPQSVIAQSYALQQQEGLASLGSQAALPFDKSLAGSYHWDYLGGTEKEKKNIAAIFEKQQIRLTLFDSIAATEDKFKTISGHSPKILHIATHGFFFEPKNINQNKLRVSGIREQLKYSSNPMLRSGLILAGANYAWQNGHSLLHRDDGILTAYEIANLDLSNTRLVVLSACESGLGDAMGVEGNFGLQRAFRLAGVNKLIISLWKVSDDKTGVFMTAFYKNWVSLKTIRKAFRQTQIELQQEGPYITGAFVLVE